MVFEGVEAGFDSLSDWSEGAVAWLFVFSVGSEEGCAGCGDVLFELGAGEAFVADDGLAGLEGAFEQVGGDGSFGLVGG